MNVGGHGSWEAQEVSRSPEVNLTSTELSEHVAAKGYLLPPNHPPGDTWPGKDTNTGHTNLRNFRHSSWPPAQKHKPNCFHCAPQTYTVNRTFLFTEDTCAGHLASRTTNPRSAHNLTVRRGGLTPSFT